MKNLLAGVFLFVFTSQGLYAQFKLDADIRPRFEYRHGFGNLFPDDAEPGAFVQQRTRLNAGYLWEKLSVKVSIQDVSTWGDEPQISSTDSNNSLMLFQAWAQIDFNEHWAVKLGRQTLSYDDQRILGGLDWAMQGRFHDLALIKFKQNNFKVDAGFAFNQQGVSSVGNDYFLNSAFSYKTMQFAHLHQDFDNSSASFLFLNSGFQNVVTDDEGNTATDGVFYRQTTGAHIKFPIGPVNLAGNVYYQFGKATAETDLSAYEFSIDAGYQPGSTLFGLGFEMLSGTDQTGSSKNNSFFPLYGTNHKFNGFMDYFYVGNHANNVGLNDLFAKVVFKLFSTSKLETKLHYFSAQAELANDADSYLGTELDLVFTQPIIKNVLLYVGYSHMFAGDSMSLVKGGIPSDNTNNWAWVQVNINPTLFDSAKEKPKTD